MNNEVDANTLYAAMNENKGFIDVGSKPENFRKAVDDLREAGHIILVGCRMKQDDGKVSQVISFGQPESEKASEQL